MSIDSKTGFVFDDRMLEHECIWDPHYIENPVRYSSSLKKCKDYGLLDRCSMISSRYATEEELCLVHTKEYVDIIKSSECLEDESDLEALAAQYDSVYFNNKTYKAALLAAGSTLQLVSSVLTGSVNNGMAIVRPPGHHAMSTDACGFCFFNNVAIAAKYALKHFNLSRILIVDWDVHHGQATQRIFYDDPRVLYFSIHRYENGAFWPHLRESNFDYSGGNSAKGFNINVPLNGNGQGNAEYLAIFNNILLPIAYEFSPELVLISAGFDAALGCPEGEMKVAPQTYPHFINLLSCLADGRICVVLEGGYCISSLSESVALTLKGLLGDPCPPIDPCLNINQISIDSILNVLSIQHKYWKSIKLQPLYNSHSEYNIDKHFVHIEYTGNPLEGLSEFPTKDCNPVVLPHVSKILESQINELIAKTKLFIPEYKTLFVLTSKLNSSDFNNYEINNTVKIFKHNDCGALSKCTYLETNENTEPDELIAVLNLKGINKIKSILPNYNEDNIKTKQNFPQTTLKNCYNFLHLIEKVLRMESLNGFSLTYPSHSVSISETKTKLNEFNHIAFATTYLIQNCHMDHILIINWSCDHNNIQQMFYEDDKVLTISLHYCGKLDCPHLVQDVGSGKGKGYNVNIPFSHSVTDGDYLSALFHIILPVAYEFSPSIILISSTFNIELISPVTPSCYGAMIKILSTVCGRIVIDIEGWENNLNFDKAMHCVSGLVGNSRIPLVPGILKPSLEAIETIQNVVKTQKKYWRSLAFYKALPAEVLTESETFYKDTKRRQSSDPVAIPRKQDEPGTSKMDDWIGEAAGFDSAVELFCVTPLEYCPHLELLQPIPVEGLNPFARCNSCNDPNENWVCLHCYQVFCGRFINQHMMQHGQDMQHFLTLSYSDLSVWCYACDAYIHNQQLVSIKEHAHEKKFGN